MARHASWQASGRTSQDHLSRRCPHGKGHRTCRKQTTSAATKAEPEVARRASRGAIAATIYVVGAYSVAGGYPRDDVIRVRRLARGPAAGRRVSRPGGRTSAAIDGET